MTVDKAKMEYELALINQYTLEELSQEDVCVFSIRLCDTKVNAEAIRLTVDALFDIKRLFVGKNGVVDVAGESETTIAKIISCDVEREDNTYVLTARAYLTKCEKNRSIIGAIKNGVIYDADCGIVAADQVCSICHYDMKSPLCNHVKCRHYDDKLCFGEVYSVTDAYDFTVMLPRQIKYKAKVRKVTRSKYARQNSV